MKNVSDAPIVSASVVLAIFQYLLMCQNIGIGPFLGIGIRIGLKEPILLLKNI